MQWNNGSMYVDRFRQSPPVNEGWSKQTLSANYVTTNMLTLGHVNCFVKRVFTNWAYVLFLYFLISLLMVDVKIGEEVDMSKGWRFRVGGETRKKIAQHWVRIKDAPFGLSGTLPTEEVVESSCEPANSVIIPIIIPYK